MLWQRYNQELTIMSNNNDHSINLKYHKLVQVANANNEACQNLTGRFEQALKNAQTSSNSCLL